MTWRGIKKGSSQRGDRVTEGSSYLDSNVFQIRYNNATKLRVWERSHLAIWLHSIFCSLVMWVAEKIPKLWRKDQPFATDFSTNSERTQRETQHFAVLC